MGPSKAKPSQAAAQHTRIELELRALPIASPAFLRPLQRGAAQYRHACLLSLREARGSRRTEGLEAERRQRAPRHSDKW